MTKQHSKWLWFVLVIILICISLIKPDSVEALARGIIIISGGTECISF